MKDYYKLLELKELASESEIKKAYHRLAKIYHPDKNENTKLAEDKFKEINEAYNVLSNPVKKSQYDTLRKAKNQTFNYQYKGDPRGYQYNQTNQKKADNSQSEPRKKVSIPSRWRTLAIPIAFFITGGLMGWFLKTLNENKKNIPPPQQTETITIWPTGAIEDLGIQKFKLTTSYKSNKLFYEFNASLYENNGIIIKAIIQNSYAQMNIEFLDENGILLFSIPLLLTDGFMNLVTEREQIGLKYKSSIELPEDIYKKFKTVSFSKNF